MNKKLGLSMVLIAIFSFKAKAQEKENTSSEKLISHLVVKLNGQYQFSSAPIRNHLAYSSEIGVYFKEKFYLAFVQGSSFSPTDILKNNYYENNALRSYEYGIAAGYLTDLTSGLYLYTGTKIGYGGVRMKNKIAGSTGKLDLNSGFTTPEVKLGLKVNPYLSLEAGVKYRYFFGNERNMELETSNMNSFGVGIGIVGTLPITKNLSIK